MSKIRVHVVHYGDCKNLVMRYLDPVSGKWVRSTKYKDPQTGVETETGTNRKLAKKLAAMWEADLNAGRDQGRHAIAWAQFRLRYEDEVAPGMAVRTGDKIGTVFNQVEKVLPKVAKGKLVELDSAAISRLQAEWRLNQLSENTIAGNLAHLHAALVWAQDQGLIPTVPKIKKPKRAKKRGKGTKAKGRPLTLEEFERMLGKVRQALEAGKLRKRALDQQTRQRAGRKVRPQAAGARGNQSGNGRVVAALPPRPMAARAAVGGKPEPLLGPDRPPAYRPGRQAADAGHSRGVGEGRP